MRPKIQILPMSELSFKEALEIGFYRKKAFVDELHWDLPYYGGQAYEIDQFDTAKAEYLVASDGNTIAYSARLLKAEDSMVQALWPDMMEHVSSTSVEVSRFVGHAWKGSPTSFPLRESLAAHGIQEIFGVADRAMIAFYVRQLKWRPDFIQTYADLNLVKWDVPQEPL